MNATQKALEKKANEAPDLNKDVKTAPQFVEPESLFER